MRSAILLAMALFVAAHVDSLRPALVVEMGAGATGRQVDAFVNCRGGAQENEARAHRSHVHA